MRLVKVFQYNFAIVLLTTWVRSFFHEKSLLNHGNLTETVSGLLKFFNTADRIINILDVKTASTITELC